VKSLRDEIASLKNVKPDVVAQIEEKKASEINVQKSQFADRT
jgi:hypothetical protein